MFVSRLHYNLYNLNAISIAAELSLYLPVSIFGYFVDRYSPRPVALVSAGLFAIGYFLAAFTYRAGPSDEGGWPIWVMIVAFVFIGMGTCSMYLAAVTTCAKNFAQSRYKGLALSIPIAAFGLSGMWQSQIGSHLLYETNEDGSHGNVDVFRYFMFLGGTLLAAGVIGSIFQKVVNEEELIEDAVESLERSGLLEDSAFFQRHDILYDASNNARHYGTIDSDDDNDTLDDTEALTASLLKVRDEEQRKKTWLLNNETRRFLSDHTMWLLALGFFLVTGPVETFINNLGTMLAALYPPNTEIPDLNSRATNVSVLALTSTIARLLAGLVSDLISPSPPEKSAHAQYSAFTPVSHHVSNPFDALPRQRCSISRLTLLIISAGLLLTVGYLLLLSPLITSHPSSFVAVSAILGTVNGAAFALVPLLISGVWGVQNFGTNWGIVAMMPALGATLWSALYSVGYQAHVDDSGLCYGQQCFNGVSWGMAAAGIAAMVSWVWIGWGKNGWWSHGIVV
jgi:MFS family permease